MKLSYDLLLFKIFLYTLKIWINIIFKVSFTTLHSMYQFKQHKKEKKTDLICGNYFTGRGRDFPKRKCRKLIRIENNQDYQSLKIHQWLKQKISEKRKYNEKKKNQLGKCKKIEKCKNHRWRRNSHS